MGQLHAFLGLMLQLTKRALIGSQRVGKNFQRDIDIEPFVERLPHDAHPSLTQPLLENIPIKQPVTRPMHSDGLLKFVVRVLRHSVLAAFINQIPSNTQRNPPTECAKFRPGL